jgi:NAD(P)-dependent dehydrogenase (short-subunit alcohol dehydrogenase family)
MGRFDGQAAIITGAGRGLGAAYACALADEGAAVTVADVIDTGATVAAITGAGGRAIGVSCDVTDPAQIGAMVAATMEAFGRIDILVNNAARVVDFDHGSFLDIDEAEWDSVMQVNTRGAFSCVKAVAPVMREAGYGKIVNISSGTAFKGTPWMLHYVSSKGAVVAFTRALARELGDDGICVNALAPGLTMSEAIAASDQFTSGTTANLASRAIKREEQPDDLLGAMLFLCSSDSDFVTGQTLVVDGGSAMH